MTEKLENEAYLCTKAKEVLKEWFDTSSDGYDGREIGEFSFRPNRTSGVWINYPICVFKKEFTSWIHNWDEINMNDDDTGPCLGGWEIEEFLPSVEHCVLDFHVKPVGIIDVVCTHKGSPIYGFMVREVFDKVSPSLIKKLKTAGVDRLYEIKAEWILNHKTPPYELKYKRLI